MIRPANPNDFEAIKGLHEKFGEFPLITPWSLGAVVSENANTITGYGSIVLLSEMLLMVDKDKSVREKVRTLNELLQYAQMFGRKIGLKELYAFVKDPHFVDILKKHHNFETCNGEALLVRL